ncbi:uracil phosphoribosyltransferase-domain-containing protein [Dichotomocladium elegans]|nr:uracil phosphoribosyltransferase-domain-containing protein [Dichotomocladium elegans]
MDSFYNILTPEQSAQAHANNFDFDKPAAFDYDLLYETLCKLKHGQELISCVTEPSKSVHIPVYDFSRHARAEKSTSIYGANVIIFEGIYSLYDKRIRDLMDLKSRLLYCPNPQIIPRGLENVVAIDLITKHIQQELNGRKLHLRWDLANTPIDSKWRERNIEAMAGAICTVGRLIFCHRLQGMHTILRDTTTSRDDFIFYAERLSTLISECALNLLPYEEKTVRTPAGAEYKGTVLATKICGVSILRAGGTLETGLHRVYNDAVIGKILIQSDPSTGEPQLHYCKLPSNIKEYHILLMDATIGTGAAGLMAIRVLLDHDVPEDHIIFTTYLSAPVGLNAIKNAFPKVKIVTSMVDPILSKETLFIEPGIGNFGGTNAMNKDDPLENS